MQALLEAVNHHIAAFGLHINTLKNTVMSVRIPGEQRQAVLPDGEPLKDVDMFKNPASCSLQTLRAPKRFET